MRMFARTDKGDDLAARLVAIHSGLYSGWTAVQVSAAAKPHGLKSVQINGGSTAAKSTAVCVLVTLGGGNM